MQSRTVLLPSGANLSYCERAAVKYPRKPSPTAIFLHDYLGSEASWAQVLDHVGDSVRLLALSLPGWGHSSKQGPYSISSYAETVVAVMDALNVEHAFLVGHGMGALVALAVSASSPGRVHGLVLFSCAHVIDPDTVADPLGSTFRQIGELWTDWVTDFPTDGVLPQAAHDFLTSFLLEPLKPFVESGKIKAEATEKVMAVALQAEPQACREAWASMINDDRREALSAISVPSQVVWGSADSMAPRTEQQKLMEALHRSLPRSFVEVTNGPRNCIATHPRECAKVISEFIGNISMMWHNGVFD